MSNKINCRQKWILLAAIAAVPVGGLNSQADAQYMRQDQGDALDSNRRIGDDRRNSMRRDYRIDYRQEAIRQPTGNQIVTGNVTGLSGFRGPVGYTSDREFRGPVSSGFSDSFIRSSAGTAGASNRVTNYNVSVPFYPAGRTVEPPPGFVQQNLAGGGYVPSSTIDNRIDRGAVTQRGGSLVLGAPIEPQQPLDTRSVLTASPLLGVQQVPLAPQQPTLFGEDGTLLDDPTILRMRDELLTGTASQERLTAGLPADALRTGSNRSGIGADGTGGLGTLGAPLQGLNGGDVGARPGGPIGAQPIDATAGGTTGQASRRRPLPSPGEQTPAYAELQRKLREYASDPNMTDEQAFRAAQRARREAEAAAESAEARGTNVPTTPGAVAPGQPPQQQKDPNAPPQSDAERLGLTDYSKRNEQVLKGTTSDQPAGAQSPTNGPSTPRAVIVPPGQPQQQPPQTAAPAARGPRPTPVQIKSLAAGVPGKGLADLLTSAEALMQEGRFASALEKYDQAAQVAPNNPLIKLGRANAELGASYFARAEEHLREAFAADEALLMGQYDLRTFFGEDRLREIANDLKEIANTEQSQVTPVFLLAYIAYNSGNERMAAGYLDLAEKRAGGKDPLIQKIRSFWVLPGTETAQPAEPSEEPVEPVK